MIVRADGCMVKASEGVCVRQWIHPVGVVVLSFGLAVACAVPSPVWAGDVEELVVTAERLYRYRPA